MTGWLGPSGGVLVFQLEALLPGWGIPGRNLCTKALLVPKAVLSSPALSWFWHISPLCQKPRVLELKGATDSKCSIPFLLQVRKLRQGRTASQWEHQGQSPSLHPCWELRVGRGRAHLVAGPEANHFLCLPSQASSLHPAVEDMGWFHQSRLGGRLGR